jgi:hypothetical protein
VDYRDVACPWEVGNDNAAVVPKYDGFVAPKTFRFVNGKAMLYEFHFSSTPPSSETSEEFLDDLA